MVGVDDGDVPRTHLDLGAVDGDNAPAAEEGEQFNIPVPVGQNTPARRQPVPMKDDRKIRVADLVVLVLVCGSNRHAISPLSVRAKSYR